MAAGEESAFWAAIDARPRDWLPVLILADWLDDRGDQRGQALRWLADRRDVVRADCCETACDNHYCLVVDVDVDELPPAVRDRLPRPVIEDGAAPGTCRVTDHMWCARADFYRDFAAAWAAQNAAECAEPSLF